MKIRCFGSGKDFYEKYHDDEWGIPEHDDQMLFEMISLEGAQAGLSWETILKRRAGYRKAFHNFDVAKVAMMSDADLELLRSDTGIIRNRLKINSVRNNAIVFQQIQKEFGSFDTYLWRFVNNKQIVNNWENRDGVPATTKISDELSKDLKKRGMKFVGSTIMYAYMQSVGLVNDHRVDCWRYGL